MNVDQHMSRLVGDLVLQLAAALAKIDEQAAQIAYLRDAAEKMAEDK
jgi:hypothetical protein